MITGEAIKSLDEVSATLEQAYYELMTEARLARVGLKERQETAPIVARYETLYTKEQIEALRGEIERAGDGERREELIRLHNALLEGYVEARVAALDDEVVSSFAAATTEVDGETYPICINLSLPETDRGVIGRYGASFCGGCYGSRRPSSVG